MRFFSFLFKNHWKRIQWTFFTISCLVFFTFFKLPKEPIHRWLEFSLKKAMLPYRVSFRAEESYLSYMLGISYTLKNVDFFSLESGLQTAPSLGHFDKIQISPKILGIFFKKMGASFLLSQSQGSLKAEFSVRDSTDFHLSYQAKNFDLQKTGFLALFSGIQVRGLLEGSGDLSGNIQSLDSFKGQGKLKIQEASIEPQVFLGFSIPTIALSEVRLALLFEKETLLLQEVQLGRKALDLAKLEDVRGTISGNIKLGKTWNASVLQTSFRINFSEKFMKSFFFLSGLLANSKQEDESYAFRLEGPVSSVQFTPLKHP